ncbi:hypothetical protein BJF79_19495 [Actinomadura sp. CNU-125]|uniref:M56 family metallopeptidase n=1 Tax=Actinomadura sp. CNU-125 TaxID=1904961 RepID=UPI0009596C76|nr:M56 family metallopeptidase [Actinomadura sp. CNU-125]OLT13875.1 hypothetical protein BJF79_19495 [Actinomadura sp. CNU-125]
MIVWIRRHPIAAAVFVALIAARPVRYRGAPSHPEGDMIECIAAAALIMLGCGLVAVTVRAVHVAVGAARAVAALPRTPVPDEVNRLARAAGVRSLRCVGGEEVTAFCAGSARPRVYVTTAAIEAFDEAELAAVLAHEAAHARRRDPLRRLLAGAVADVFFYVPLARWWLERHVRMAEVGADRAAIVHAGRAAVASALLAAGDATASVPRASFTGATQARVAQLLGDRPPAMRPDRSQVMLSFLGLYGAIVLVMCTAPIISSMSS